MSNALLTPTRLPLVAPSILSADFARMGEACRSTLAPSTGDHADLLHLDVMDGHFVPNLTMGPDMCLSLRRAFPEVTLDVHLMVTDPVSAVAPYRDAGADHLTFHIEPAASGYKAATGAGGGPEGRGFDPMALAQRVRDAGMSVGIAINPPTPVETVLDLLEAFDMALVMSVNPGRSGQKFIETSLEKTRRIRAMLREEQRLEMDGGISLANAAEVREAGCDVLVAASAIFGREAADRPGVIASLRGVCERCVGH